MKKIFENWWRLEETYSTAKTRAGDYGSGVDTVDAWMKQQADKRKGERDHAASKDFSRRANQKAADDEFERQKRKKLDQEEEELARKKLAQANARTKKEAQRIVTGAFDMWLAGKHVNGKLAKVTSVSKQNLLKFQMGLAVYYLEDKGMSPGEVFKKIEGNLEEQANVNPPKSFLQKAKGWLGMGESLALSADDIHKMIQEEMSAVMTERKKNG